MDMELEQKQEELINHFVQQASSLSGSDLASLVVEATSHPSLFAFSKILSVPSILQLEGTDDSVYLDVLRLFAEGTLSDYKRNAGRLPELVHDQELKLKQLTMLTLAETNKELPYDQLMQQLEVANVPELEEFLIHKCMHVGIVRGEVDTLRNRFGVQFAAVRNPRPEQHGSMIQELSKWSDISESLPILIEEKIDWADKICKPNKQHRMEDEDEEIKRSLKVAEEPKKEKKRKNKMKAKQKNSSHDDLEAKYGLDEGEEEGLKSEEAEGLRSEEEEKKKGIIEDSGKTKKRTKEMNRQQRKRKKDRKARKRAAMVGANTSVKKNKDKKGQKKEPVSTVPHDTSSSSGESESAQDEVSTVLSTPSKHQTGEAAAIMHDVLANEDVGKPGVEDEVLGGSDTVTATSQVQTPNATHDEMDQLRVVQEQTANMEQNVEKKLNSDAHAFKQYEESFNSKLEAQFQTLSQQFEKSVNSKLEAHFQTLGQQAVQQINMQRKLENQMTKIEKAVEQKLNSNSHAFNQFEKLFNSKLEAQFQTLGQQAVQINLGRILPKFPSLLSQDVLISLFKLLAGDVNNDRLHKIVWMMTVANCINLADPRTGKYARSVLSLVNRSLFCIIDTSLTLTTIELRGIEQLTSIITSKLSESD